MSMAFSLEARVLYLDLEYLAYLEAIPGPQRIGVVESAAAATSVGTTLVAARAATVLRSSTSPWRRKHGFDVPVAEWFRGSFRDG
jgi:hypothetical protein